MKKYRSSKGGYYHNQPHKSYWTQRSKERLSESFSSSDKVNEYITQQYQQCLIDFCGKYNELVKPYVKDGVLDVAALQKARVTDVRFAAKYMRLLREIDMLKDTLGKPQQAQILSLLEQVYKDNVIKNFEDLGAQVTKGMEILNKSAIESAIKTPFTSDGREFSDRIWDNLDRMGGKLRATLAESITKGESIQKTTRKFKDIFGNTTYNTERIIRTETIAAYAKASRDSYEALGVEEMQVLTEANACDVCGKAAKKKIKVRGAQVGLDIPPFHPFCKCCVIPIVKMGN